MSVTTVLHTSVWFVILYVKNNHSLKKELQHTDISPFIIRVLPRWLFCFSFSMFLLPRFPYSKDLNQACLFHSHICTQHIQSNFPLLYQELFIPTKSFLQISLRGVTGGGGKVVRQEGKVLNNYFMQIRCFLKPLFLAVKYICLLAIIGCYKKNSNHKNHSFA